MQKIPKHPYVTLGILKPELVTEVTLSPRKNSPQTYSIAKIDCQKLTRTDLANLITNLPVGATINYFEFMFDWMQEVDDFTGLYILANRNEIGFRSGGGNHGRTRASEAIGQLELIESIWGSSNRSGSYLHIFAEIERSTRQSAP